MYSRWLPDNVSLVDACHGYRGKMAGQTDEAYVARLREQLVAEFARLGGDTVAAFIAETVGGSTLACVPAVLGYFPMVREVCDEYGALLILEEVCIRYLPALLSSQHDSQVKVVVRTDSWSPRAMCGMGRTGTTHAWQQEGIRGPDLQNIEKSLGGGSLPLFGVLVHQHIFEVIATPQGALAGDHTFQAHPVACAAALAVQQIIERDHLLENVRGMGRRLKTLLKTNLGPQPLVGGIRGRGLFWTVEFVSNKDARRPFDLRDDFSGRVGEEALRQDVQVLRNMGFPGTWKVDSVVICPPFMVKMEELGKIVARLKQALEMVATPYLRDIES